MELHGKSFSGIRGVLQPIGAKENGLIHVLHGSGRHFLEERESAFAISQAVLSRPIFMLPHWGNASTAFLTDPF
jgi:hypothetical protein